MKHLISFSCKIIFMLALLHVSSTTAVCAQTQQRQAGKDIEAALIKQVRADYEQINKANLTKKTVHWTSPDSCQPTYMEGTISYFYNNKELVKIYNEGGEDHGEWKEEYYFKKGEVFFIYQNNAYGGAANPVEFKYQNRFYFKEGKLVKTIRNTNSEQDSTEPTQLVQLAKSLATHTNQAAVSRIMSCGSKY